MSADLIAAFLATGGTIKRAATLSPAQVKQAATDARKAAKAATLAKQRAAYLADREKIAALIQCKLIALYGDGNWRITKSLELEYKQGNRRVNNATVIYDYILQYTYTQAMRQIAEMPYNIMVQVNTARHIAAETFLQSICGFYDARMFDICAGIAAKYRIDEIELKGGAAQLELAQYKGAFN